MNDQTRRVSGEQADNARRQETAKRRIAIDDLKVKEGGSRAIRGGCGPTGDGGRTATTLPIKP